MAILHVPHSYSNHSDINIRQVNIVAPLRWLADGINDFRVAPITSMLYGMVFAVIGMLILMMSNSYPAFTLAAISGFFLIGPFVAIGLYDMSAQIANGNQPSLIHATRHIRFNTISVVSFAFIITFIFVFWARFTAILTSVLFNNADLATEGWISIFVSEGNTELMLTFMLTGLGLAILVFTISVVAVPMMTDRKIDVITAMFTSIRAVKKNILPMILWAGLLVAMIGLGIVTFYIGLIVTLPIIGHASWHAYQDLVND